MCYFRPQTFQGWVTSVVGAIKPACLAISNRTNMQCSEHQNRDFSRKYFFVRYLISLTLLDSNFPQKVSSSEFLSCTIQLPQHAIRIGQKLSTKRFCFRKIPSSKRNKDYDCYQEKMKGSYTQERPESFVSGKRQGLALTLIVTANRPPLGKTLTTLKTQGRTPKWPYEIHATYTFTVVTHVAQNQLQ